MAEPTLMDKVQQLGAGAQPVTALGAQMVGGTPKQQDMAGSAAAKNKVMKENTLAGAQRLGPPTAAAPAAVAPVTAQAAATAQVLKEVGGSLSARIPAAIEKKITEVAQTAAGAQPQVAQTALGTAMGLTPAEINAQKADPNSKYNQISNILITFANSPDPATQTAALAQLQASGMDPASAAGLINTTATAVGQVVPKQALTIEQLDLTGLAEGVNNINDLATVLGMPATELAKISVEQLPQLVQDVQQREAARVQQVRAELASLPPGSQQAQMLLQELQALEAGGFGEVERQSMQEIQKLNVADNIEIGGRQYTAKDLLEDDQLSNLITSWLQAAPEARESIISSAEYPDLIKWLGANERGLAALTANLKQGVESFTKTQQEAAKIGETSGVSKETIKASTGIDTDQPMTPDQLKAAEEAYNNSTIGKLAAEGNPALITAIEELSPELKAEFLSKSPDEVKAAFSTAEALQADPDLAAISGITAEGKFITDPAQIAKVQSYKQALDIVKQKNSIWLTEPFFRNLRPDQMIELSQNPDRYHSLKQFYTNYKQVYPLVYSKDKQNPKLLDSLLDTVMGKDVNAEDINRQYSDAVKWAKLGDPDAKTLQQRLESTFGLSTLKPTLGEATVTRLQKSLQKLTYDDPDAIIRGDIQVTSGPDVLSSKASLIDTPFSPKADSLFSKFSSYLEDGKLDSRDLLKMTQTADSKDIVNLIKMMPNKDKLLKSYGTLTAQADKTKIAEFAATLLPQGVSDMTAFLGSSKELGALPRSQFDQVMSNIEASKQAILDQAKGNPTQEAWAKNYIKQLDKLRTKSKQAINNVEGKSTFKGVTPNIAPSSTTSAGFLGEALSPSGAITQSPAASGTARGSADEDNRFDLPSF